MNEALDFTVLKPVVDPRTGFSAYLPGEGISGQVVDDLGLTVGEDVTPARANVVPAPAGNASRADWVRYAQYQSVQDGGPSQDDIDGMTRDQLRDLYVAADEKTAKAKPSGGPAAKDAKGAAPVKGE